MGTRDGALHQFLLVFLLLAAPLSAYADMRGDMVKFDQDYIPVLFLSKQEQPQSAAAMDKLLATWAWFKQSYAYHNGRDPQWNFDFTQIEHQLLEAQRLIEEKSCRDAHDALEPVRMTLMGMRERIGMAYFIDALVRFHEPMEAIAMQAGMAMPQAAEDAGIDAIKQNYTRARSLWSTVLNWNLNPYDYGLDSRQGEVLRQHLLEEERALQHLGQALAGNDRKAIAEAAAAIRPPFVQCYRSFGRFPAMPK
jgi:hypothetical protein